MSDCSLRLRKAFANHVEVCQADEDKRPENIFRYTARFQAFRATALVAAAPLLAMMGFLLLLDYAVYYVFS